MKTHENRYLYLNLESYNWTLPLEGYFSFKFNIKWIFFLIIKSFCIFLQAWIVIIFSMFIGALAAWVVSVLILHILHDGSNEPHALPRFSDDLFYFFSTLSFQGL